MLQVPHRKGGTIPGIPVASLFVSSDALLGLRVLTTEVTLGN